MLEAFDGLEPFVVVAVPFYESNVAPGGESFGLFHPPFIFLLGEYVGIVEKDNERAVSGGQPVYDLGGAWPAADMEKDSFHVPSGLPFYRLTG
jgi:hypothetical protein